MGVSHTCTAYGQGPTTRRDSLSTVSEVKFQSDLLSAEDAQLLLPKLTDGQLAVLKSYGTTEKTSIGQVLATAGDFTYDLMVVLDGEVECSDIHDGRRRALLVHRLRTPVNVGFARRLWK